MKNQTRNGHKNSPIYKKRAKLWRDALIKNEKKATGVMHDGCGGRCCLAVAQDIARKQSKKINNIVGEEYSIAGMPHNLVVQYFGWAATDPEIGAKGFKAAIHNDGVGECPIKSHKQIAALVTREWELDVPTK